MTTAVVDAYGIGQFLPAALSRYGVDCIHVRSEFPDLHLSYRPEDFEVEIQHRGDLGETAAALGAHGIDFVVAASESGVLLADALAAALGTPGNGMTRPRARRDKYEMALAVRDAGLAAARSFASSDAEQIMAWALNLGEWPVVLKPVASAGTDNVLYCNSAQDVREAHARILASTDRYGRRNEVVLGQEFLSGDEYFVNTVSRDGVHHVVEVWRYHLREIAGGRWIYDHEYPMPPADPVVGPLVEYTLAVLDALEIRNSAAHTEVMVTRNGPILVESGARLGGSHLPEVVSRCLGTDQVERLALAIARPEEITERRLAPYQLLTHLRYVSLISPGEGVVPTAERFAPVRQLSSFLDVVFTLPEGKPIMRTVDLASSPGYVYLSSNHPQQVEEDYARLRHYELNGLYDP